MRATTAFPRLLRLAGASSVDVCFTGEGVVVTVRLRRRRRIFAECGLPGRQMHLYDRRVKRWRHLDQPAASSSASYACCAAATAACGWSRSRRRPGAAHTRDLEDTIAWLAQQVAFAPIAQLLRVGWHTIGPIVQRVIADPLDERRLQGLVVIGVDEISWRRHHRCLTTVVDRRSGAIYVVRARPQQRRVAGLLRRARRPQNLDRRGLAST